MNIVTLHLGNGCSACAIRAGRSVDTSMGFTPLEGLVMGTRSGDLDPALVDYLARKENVQAAEVERWLNHRSGLLGLSGISHDMRELLARYESRSASGFGCRCILLSRAQISRRLPGGARRRASGRFQRRHRRERARGAPKNLRRYGMVRLGSR